MNKVASEFIYIPWTIRRKPLVITDEEFSEMFENVRKNHPDWIGHYANTKINPAYYSTGSIG